MAILRRTIFSKLKQKQVWELGPAVASHFSVLTILYLFFSSEMMSLHCLPFSWLEVLYPSWCWTDVYYPRLY
jgi:hypothetical protein